MKVCRGKVYKVKRPAMPDRAPPVPLERDPFATIKPLYKKKIEPVRRERIRYGQDYVPHRVALQPIVCNCVAQRRPKPGVTGVTVRDAFIGQLRYFFCVSQS